MGVQRSIPSEIRPEPAPPLPPAREALARAIAALDAALKRRERARQPIGGLERVAAAAAAATLAGLREEIARLRSAHEADVAGWIEAGARGARPRPAAEMIEAERRLGEIGAAGAAAEEQLSIAREGYGGAVERARAAEIERDRAVCAAAVEAAEALAAEMRKAAAAVLQRDSLLRSLVSALREEGGRDRQVGHGAMRAAETIERAVIAARRSVVAAAPPAAGRDFLRALRADPHAALQPAASGAGTAP